MNETRITRAVNPRHNILEFIHIRFNTVIHVIKHLTTIYMKKALLMIALVVGCMSATAQKIDKNEMKELQAFLS